MNEQSTKDFELELRVRNNRLKERRLAMGLSPKQLAERIGINYGLYLRFENMHLSPIGTKGGFLAIGEIRVVTWRPAALKIAAFYAVPPETLWTDAILAVKAPQMTMQVDGGTLMAIGGATTSEWALEAGRPVDESYDATEAAESLRKLMHKLPLREQQILHQRFGLGIDQDDRTLSEVGDRLGLSRERVRHIEGRGLRRLRKAFAVRDADEPGYTLVGNVTALSGVIEADDEYKDVLARYLWPVDHPRFKCPCGSPLFRRSRFYNTNFQCTKCHATYLVDAYSPDQEPSW